MDWVLEGIISWIGSNTTGLLDSANNLFISALGVDMSAMEGYFPFVKTAFSVMQYIAWALLFLIIVWQIFRAFMGPVSEAENPVPMLARSVVFFFLIAYARPMFELLLGLARGPYSALMSLPMDSSEFTFSGIQDFISGGLGTIGITITGVGAILQLILLITVAWNYFKVLLEAVERYVVVGVLCYTSPLAYAMGASKATNNVFKGWCRMVGSQLFLLILNVWFLRAFTSSVGIAAVNNGSAPGVDGGNIILWAFCVTAFLKTIQRFDTYLAAMGMNVAQTGSSMMGELMASAKILSGINKKVTGGGGVADAAKGAAGAASGIGGMAGKLGNMASSIASKFNPTSYVRDAAVEGGERMGMGGGAGAIARMFASSSLKNGAALNSDMVGSVANASPARSGKIGGDVANSSLPNFMPHLKGTPLDGTQIQGGKIQTSMPALGKDGKSLPSSGLDENGKPIPGGGKTNLSMYSADQYEKPDAPHKTVTAADGSKWYQVASGNLSGYVNTPQYSGTGSSEDKAALNQQFPELVQSQPDLGMKTVGEGHMEGALPGGGNSQFYASALYNAPDAPHQLITDSQGNGWYMATPSASIPQDMDGMSSYLPELTNGISDMDDMGMKQAANGITDITYPDGAVTRLYDANLHQEPTGAHQTLEATNGDKFYAVSGTPTVTHQPLYKDGELQKDTTTGKIITDDKATVRFDSHAQSYRQPLRMDANTKQPREPRRK